MAPSNPDLPVKRAQGRQIAQAALSRRDGTLPDCPWDLATQGPEFGKLRFHKPSGLKGLSRPTLAPRGQSREEYHKLCNSIPADGSPTEYRPSRSDVKQGKEEVENGAQIAYKGMT